MVVVMAAVVVAPFVIRIAMGGTVLLQVGMMAPAVPMMAAVVIAVGIADGDIAKVEPDGDSGVRAGNGQGATQDGDEGGGLEGHGKFPCFRESAPRAGSAG